MVIPEIVDGHVEAIVRPNRYQGRKSKYDSE
jgi:hypothetical protein